MYARLNETSCVVCRRHSISPTVHPAHGSPRTCDTTNNACPRISHHHLRLMENDAPAPRPAQSTRSPPTRARRRASPARARGTRATAPRARGTAASSSSRAGAPRARSPLCRRQHPAPERKERKGDDARARPRKEVHHEQRRACAWISVHAPTYTRGRPLTEVRGEHAHARRGGAGGGGSGGGGRGAGALAGDRLRHGGVCEERTTARWHCSGALSEPARRHKGIVASTAVGERRKRKDRLVLEREESSGARGGGDAYI